MWIAYNAEMVGRSHLSKNIPCQDKTYFFEDESIKVLSLCDGAGSAKFSHFGAENISKNIANVLTKNFDKYFNAIDVKEVKSDILNTIISNLKELSKKHNCELKDLASTLLFVAIKDDKFILFHLGDGVIGYLKNDTLKVATSPNNGEFANETCFVTSKNAIFNIKLFKGNLSEISAFLMMSDGGADGLYHKMSNSLSKSLIKLAKYASFHRDLNENFKKSVEKLQGATFDDVSLALITKKSNFKDQNLEFRKNLLSKTNRVLKRREKIVEILKNPLNLNEISHQIYLKRKFIKRDLKMLSGLNLVVEEKGRFKSLVNN